MLALLISLDPPFLSEVQIGESGYRNIEPHIAVNDSNIVVAWIEADIHGSKNIYYRYSSDVGSTWSISSSMPHNCYTVDPFLAPDPDNANMFYAVYLDICPSIPTGHKYFLLFCKIYFSDSASCDTLIGTKPGDTIPIQDTTPKDYPRMAVAPGGKIVVSVAHKYSPSPNYYQIVIYRSLDGGITWEGPVVVDSTREANASYLAYTEGRFYLSYASTKYYLSSPSRITIGLARSDDYGATWDIIDTAAIWFLADSTTKCATRSRLIWKRPTKTIHTMIAKGDTIAIGYTRFNGMTTCNVRIAHNYNGGYGSWTGRWIDSTLNRDQIQPTLTRSDSVWYVSYLEKVDTTLSDSVWRVMWGKSVDRGNTWEVAGRVSSANFRMYGDKLEGEYMGFEYDSDRLFAVWGGDRREPDRMVYFSVTTKGMIGVRERRMESKGVFTVLKGGLEMKVKGEVYSVSGRLVFRGEGRVSLPSGVYFVKVKDKVFKVVVR